MSVLVACVYVYHIYAWCLLRSEEGVSIPGTEVRDGWEQLCGCWKPSPDPLREQGLSLLAISPASCISLLFPFTLFSGFIMYCLLCLIPFSD